MDFNEIIEAEIKKQVEERTKELENTYKNKYEEYKQNLLDNFVMPIYLRLRNVNIEIEKTKNEFDECAKTFFDNCEEFFDIKDENINRKEEIDYIDKYFGKTKKELNANDLNQKCDYPSCKNYRDGSLDDICSKCDSRLIKQEKDKEIEKNLENSCASKVKETLNKVDSKKEIKEEKTDVDKAFDLFGDFLEDFGITKDQIKDAKVKIFSNNEALSELSKIFDYFGYNKLF